MGRLKAFDRSTVLSISVGEHRSGALGPKAHEILDPAALGFSQRSTKYPNWSSSGSGSAAVERLPCISCGKTSF